MATTAKQSSSSSVRGSSPASSVARASSPSTSLKKTVSSTSSSSTLIEVRSSSVGSVSSVTGNGGEEDIETIAKQISDHAEAIYQTWKARGLAPTEILNCHSVNSDAFGKTLTPQRNNLRESPVNEILTQSPTMSNNNLKKLVSSFVSEDKARQQQTVARKANILTSGTIRDALRKFECVDSQPAANVKPNYVRYGNSNAEKSSTLVQQQQRQASPQPQAHATTTVATATATTASAPAPAASQLLQQSTYVLSRSQSPQKQLNTNNYGNQLNKNVPDVLINTIDQGKLSSTVASHEKSPSPVRIKPETPAKPASLLNHTPAWPLKNRAVVENGGSGCGGGGKSVIQTIKTATTTTTTAAAAAAAAATAAAAAAAAHNTNNSGSNSIINSHETIKTTVKKSPNNKTKTTNLLDEVLMEEERLINALKTGTVLNNTDKMLPEVITSTLMTPVTKVVTVPWSASDRDDTLVKPSTINSNTISNSNKNLNNNIMNSNSNKINSNSQTNTSEIDGGGSQVKFAIKSRHKNDAAVPHPEVHTNSSKTNGLINPRATSSVPAVRPFLTRGSVAERVLMFEKCPEAKALRNVPKEPNKLAIKPLAKPNESHTTLQRHVRGSKNVYIPRFHYPHGKPLPSIALESMLQQLQAAFDAFPNNSVSKENFTGIVKITGLPLYWRMPLFHCTQLTPAGLVDGRRFCDFWKQMSVFCHDTVSRFVFILSRGQRSRSYILPEDLVTLVQDVVDTHPGLAFLKEASEFHSRYVHTVIARIYYTVNRCWSGKITIPELRRSDFLQVIQLLEEEEDINQIMAYFSYEHFYVIYCKFWELDRDHDLFIDQNDLARHNDHALSSRIIERIFSGCVTKVTKNGKRNTADHQKMSYTEFVWFLLSEEDKTNATAVEYWFRCMDLDGDGILSMYELEYFYEEQQHRMESIGIETLPFEDCLCQMLDMIKPKTPGCVTLGDLKRCKMTPIFFDTFFNLEKYMEHEQRDPFASQRDSEEMTDWDRYAAQEYELLVAEEGVDTQASYDDEEDYESNIDILESHLDDQMTCGINDL